MECNEYAEDSVNSSEIYLAMIEYGTMVHHGALIVFEKKDKEI